MSTSGVVTVIEHPYWPFLASVAGRPTAAVTRADNWEAVNAPLGDIPMWPPTWQSGAQGWVCPKCQSVFAPSVTACYHCSPVPQAKIDVRGTTDDIKLPHDTQANTHTGNGGCCNYPGFPESSR